MSGESLHPTAIIETGATLGAVVSVGAFSIIRAGAVLGDGCKIASHVVIEGCVRLAEGVEVDCFSVIGGLPQDYSFDPTRRTGVRIGANTKVREGVTVHRATKDGADTVVGANGMLMGNSHVAHDAVLGDHVVLANGALIAGHVQVGDRAFISGNAAIHQFCRIGESAMVGGGGIITEDMPPFGISAERNRLAGLNLVGMRRRGIPTASMSDVRACYRRIYLGKSLNLVENAAAARAEGLGATPEGARFLDFFLTGGKRHRFCRPLRNGGVGDSES